MEFDEAMSSGKVYLDMAPYFAWRDANTATNDAKAAVVAIPGKEREVLGTAE